MKSLVKFRKHCFAGLTGVGIVAGILDHLWLGSISHYAIFLAMLCVIMGASLGGFAGFFVINLVRTLRRRKAYTGQHNDGVLAGAFCGAFLGILCQFLFAEQPDPIWAASIGAFAGGAAGAVPDEFLQPMMLLMNGEARPQDYAPPELVFVEPVDEN